MALACPGGLGPEAAGTRYAGAQACVGGTPWPVPAERGVPEGAGGTSETTAATRRPASETGTNCLVTYFWKSGKMKRNQSRLSRNSGDSATQPCQPPPVTCEPKDRLGPAIYLSRSVLTGKMAEKVTPLDAKRRCISFIVSTLHACTPRSSHSVHTCHEECTTVHLAVLVRFSWIEGLAVDHAHRPTEGV